jgi:ketosteroid isomerase-like protein
LPKRSPGQLNAEEALHNGDVTPRLEMGTQQEPLSVFGALMGANGWDQVSQSFRWVASRFSNCTAYNFDLVAAGVSGDLAYTVGYERCSRSWGGSVESTTLRVTHVYRRENGEWKVVHRHADPPPIDQRPSTT